MLSTVDLLLAGLARVFDWMVATLVAILVVIVSAQLVDRHFFDTGIAAPDQYARVALVWLTFIGFAVALRAAANIRVDIIESRLPPLIRRVLEIVFDVVLLLLNLLLAVKSWRLIEIGATQERLGTVLTEAVPASALLAACVFMALCLALRIFLRLAGREPAAPKDT